MFANFAFMVKVFWCAFEFFSRRNEQMTTSGQKWQDIRFINFEIESVKLRITHQKVNVSKTIGIFTQAILLQACRSKSVQK